MIGRAVAAAAHGCFFGLAILLAASIAPPGRQGMALAIVVGGINVANIVGVPLGTADRQRLRLAGGLRHGRRDRLRRLRGHRRLRAERDAGRPRRGARCRRSSRRCATRGSSTSYAIIVMQMIAFWSLSTFIAPYFTETGGVGEDVLPLILFAFGIFGGARHRRRRALCRPLSASAA